MFLLQELLRQSASTAPQQVAVIGPKSSISYEELDRRSDQLAHSLIRAGVTPGEPVGIAMHKCIDAIVGVYGILKSGGCYVPIDAFAPVQRSAAVVENTQMQYLLTTADRVKGLVGALVQHKGCATLKAVLTPDSDSTTALALDIRTWDSGAACPLPALTDTHLAYVLHTSGSTGKPKGVAITHRNALCFIETAADYWQVGSDDRLCSQAPLHFDLSVFDLYVAALRGASVVLIPEFYAAFPKKMAAAIDAQGITIWNSVVSTLTLMMERGKPELQSFKSLRAVIFSGEVMPARYLRRLYDHMSEARFYNVYGQTEANSSMVYPLDRDRIPSDDGWKIPLGKALPNFEVFALDPTGEVITEAGQAGELLVRSGTVAAGYWGNAALTSQKFVIDPKSPNSGARVYRTGDLVRLDDEGNYLFGGRTDDMIKSRGYRVELGDIDLALLSCSGVESAAAIAIPDDEVGNRLFAFATLSEGTTMDAEAILAHCRERLPKYMIPEQLTLRDNLPRTSTNKIDRKVLRTQLVEELER